MELRISFNEARHALGHDLFFYDCLNFNPLELLERFPELSSIVPHLEGYADIDEEAGELIYPFK